MDKYFKNFNELSLNVKRDILIKEIEETLLTIEKICLKNKIKIEKLKSSKYLKNNKLLFEEDYYDLMFIYIVYLKEDLASLIEKY